MITVERIGRRSYLRGAPFEIRERLKAAGAKWDPDARAWWLGKDEAARALAAEAADAKAKEAVQGKKDALTDDSPVQGRATYKGRSYLLVWSGTTARGQAAKLASMDGSLVFWAELSEVEVTKHYQAREYRGRVQPMTLGRLTALRERYAKGRAEGYADGIPAGHRYRCEECDEWVVRGQGNCWETGLGH
jgi:hypothetical protein